MSLEAFKARVLPAKNKLYRFAFRIIGDQEEAKDIVQEVMIKVWDSFIHVEMFDNPDEIQGDLSRARTVSAAAEWGLPSEPWTFVVDADGLIAAKFEGFATLDELEEALADVLR